MHTTVFSRCVTDKCFALLLATDVTAWHSVSTGLRMAPEHVLLNVKRSLVLYSLANRSVLSRVPFVLD